MTAMRPARQRLLAVGAALALSAALAGCSGESGGKGGAQSGVLTVATGAAGNFTRNFNPFSPNALQATHGMIYEPLFFFNTVKSGDVRPWLGKSYQWADGGKTLHIRIRTDATWNDGKPFTNSDVAFSFNLALKNKDLNRYALPLRSVAKDGSDGVTLTFTSSAYTKEYFMLGKMDMLAEHSWGRIPQDKMATTLNTHPVGTGAWTVRSVTPTVINLNARDDYYLDGMPKFKAMRYLAFSGNTSSTAAIATGRVDWAGDFIPNIEKNYLAKDPKFSLVNVPLAVNFLVPNAKQGVTADPAVRKAISAGLNRDFMIKTVYNGQAPATNPMALLRPNYDSVLDPALSDAAFETGADKVDGYLTGAGYTKGSDGFYAKDGKKLSITVKIVSGYTDYISLAQTAKQQLAKVGIDLNMQTEAYATWTSDQATGKFEMLMSNYGYTPDPRAYYDQMLNSKIATPLGKPDTVGNYGRYANPTVDQALANIAATTDLAKQKPWFYKIQREFMKDMPLIPLNSAQNEQEFNGNHVAGFPTKDNPYASASVWLAPDCGWVAARLKPVTGKK